jgi:type VI secretion system protein ImpH
MVKKEKDRLTTYIEAVRMLRADIKLEVIMAELMEAGLPLEDIMVMSNSVFRRNFSKEIEKIEELEVGSAHKKKLAFYVNREGLYDRLPQDLFHQPDQSVKGGKAVLDEMAQQKVREKSARQFFVPFEQELYRLMVKLEWEERQFIFETNGEVSGDLLGRLWDIPDQLDSLQRSKLGVIMPVLHRFGGDNERLAFVMESISGTKVSIRSAPPLSYEMTEFPELGKVFLGVDSLLGGTVYETQSSITVGLIAENPEDLDTLMPGGKMMGIVEYLTGSLVPFEQDVTFEPDLSALSLEFALDPDISYVGRLNYTTVL